MLLLAGCGTAATLVETTPSGGVVTYAFNPALGHLASPFRDDALSLIAGRCAGAYSIVREGETRPRFREVQTVAGPEVIEEHRWGIRFRCDGTGNPTTGEPPSSRLAPEPGDPEPPAG